MDDAQALVKALGFGPDAFGYAAEGSLVVADQICSAGALTVTLDWDRYDPDLPDTDDGDIHRTPMRSHITVVTHEQEESA